MFLTTGPTGSGKTTTLYSVLHKLNSVEKNIFTIEDPVEYQLSGISQVQVHKKAGLSFAKRDAQLSSARTRTSSWSVK